MINSGQVRGTRTITSAVGHTKFSILPIRVSLSSHISVLKLVRATRRCKRVTVLIGTTKISPSRTSIRAVLGISLCNATMLLRRIKGIVQRNKANIAVTDRSKRHLPTLNTRVSTRLTYAPARRLLDLRMLRPSRVHSALRTCRLTGHYGIGHIVSRTIE